MYKSCQLILIWVFFFPLKVVKKILAVVGTVCAVFSLQMCQNTSNADTVAVIVATAQKKKNKLTGHFFLFDCHENAR